MIEKIIHPQVLDKCAHRENALTARVKNLVGIAGETSKLESGIWTTYKSKAGKRREIVSASYSSHI